MDRLISESEWLTLVRGLQAGDPTVVQSFYAKCGPILRAIADKRVAPHLQRRFDADDVVQLTFRTFFRRANGGQFLFEDNQRLWNLLCAITLTKLREKARYHQRQSRAAGREQSFPQDGPHSEREPQLVAPIPAPDAALEFADELQNLLKGLDETERRLVDIKLQDRTNDEAAEELGVSERTVRRLLAVLQTKFEQQLTAN